MGFFGRKRAPSVPHPRKEPRFDGPLTLERLEQIFQDCVDFTKRPVSLGEGGACTLTLCYLSGMVKMERVSDYVLRPLAQDEALARCGTPRQAMDRMKDGALYNLSAEERTRLDAAVFDLVNGCCLLLFPWESSVLSLLLCKQAAKNFHTICKKETALKRVLSNLLSAVSLLRFKAVFSCGFRVPPGSGLYQSCAAGSVCIPAGQKYCSPRPRKSCPADRKTPGLPSRCIGHRW